LKLAILGDIAGRQVGMIVKNGLGGGIVAVQATAGLCLQEEIVVDEIHQSLRGREFDGGPGRPLVMVGARF